jgi:hypothetical protein
VAISKPSDNGSVTEDRPDEVSYTATYGALYGRVPPPQHLVGREPPGHACAVCRTKPSMWVIEVESPPAPSDLAVARWWHMCPACADLRRQGLAAELANRMVLEQDDADPIWLASELCVHGTESTIHHERLDES